MNLNFTIKDIINFGNGNDIILLLSPFQNSDNSKITLLSNVRMIIKNPEDIFILGEKLSFSLISENVSPNV